MIKLIKLILG